MKPKNKYRKSRIQGGVAPWLCVAFTLASSCLFPARAAQENRAGPILKFTKVLEGSVPEFMEITLDSNGVGSYDGRKLSDPPDPRPMKLSAPTTERLFQLARALNDFKAIDLDSHKDVANLGRKSLTYEANGEKNSAEYNYTLRRQAQQLTEMFEQISAVEEHIRALEYASKYDPLSLPGELLHIQFELENKSLTDPEMMAPTLQAIARNSHFLHLAQVRAQDILQHINN